MLPESTARLALNRVEEMVEAQGGRCRNLSSVLQSVCRKLEKKDSGVSNFKHKRSSSPFGGTFKPGRGDGVYSNSRRARQKDDEQDAFGTSSDSEEPPPARHAGPMLEDAALERTTSFLSAGPTDTPGGKKSWADMEESGSEDLMMSPGDPKVTEEEYWTEENIEYAAKQGFEIRKRGDHWDLRITMSGLKPPLTEVGVKRYCRWLETRLQSFKDEHGHEPLRRCRGEVDFSHNRLDNQMVRLLLETLEQNEVHAALLKLFGNLISKEGVLAICDFIRNNHGAEPLQELHLSHNEIDDDCVLELLRTLHSQRPRYPPRRSRDGDGAGLAPVWLRLNHNRIRDPDQVRRDAEAAGVTLCAASDRNACGTSRCKWKECPLVHLYAFDIQAHVFSGARRRRLHGNGSGRRH